MKTPKTKAKTYKKPKAQLKPVVRKTTAPKKKTTTQPKFAQKANMQNNIYIAADGTPYKLVPVKVKMHNDKKENHFHVILDDIDNRHVSVGLSTHKKKCANGKKGGNNYPLIKNVLYRGQKAPKQEEKTYMRRQGFVDVRDNYYNEQKGSMVENDYQKALVYGERAKKKYLDKKKSNDRAKHVIKSPSAIRRKSPVCCSNKNIAKPKQNVNVKLARKTVKANRATKTQKRK